ncbi:hypothetical protein RQP46_009337 [Phenoliferia psychrophenolica]
MSTSTPDKLDKGKARASSPPPSSESASLLPQSPHLSTHSSTSTPSRKPSATGLRHGRGPLIRDSDDEGSAFAADDLERGGSTTASLLPGGYSSSGVLCTLFCCAFFTLLLLLAVAHLWFGHFMQEMAIAGSVDEMGRRGILWEGPTALRVHGGGAPDEVVVEIEGRAGMDVRKALGWEERQKGTLWGRMEDKVARWGVDKLGMVEVETTRIVIEDPTTGLALVFVQPTDTVQVPLSYPRADDSPTMDNFRLAIPLAFPNPDELAKFAQAVWSSKDLSIGIQIEEVVVRPGRKLPGVFGKIVDKVGDVRLSHIARTVEGTLPDLPGTSDPSSLVHLDKYSIFPSTTPGNASFIALAAHATLTNPLLNSTILPASLSWGVPFSLPVAVYLPSPPPTKSPSLPPSSHREPVLLAQVYTSPFAFSPHAKSAPLDLGGALVHPSKKDETTLGAALSHFVSSYLAGKDSTILVRYDPTAQPAPGVVLPPAVVGRLAESLEVALAFPGSESQLDLFENLRIEGMKIKLGGMFGEGDDEGDLLASGKVVGDILLPKTFASLGPSIDVTAISPDVFVFDGELPREMMDAGLGWDSPDQQLSFAFAPPISSSDYPPSPVPANAFARLRPSSRIPATTIHTPANSTHNATTTLSAVFVDAPLFLLPGREDVFQRFVGKILFGGPGAKTVLSSLALIASAAAISVNTPTGWTTTGPNTISWSSVDTDKTTFAMILTNLDTQFLSTPITLVANETTDAGSVTLSLDSALPSGSGFRVNFVANLDQESTILGKQVEHELLEWLQRFERRDLDGHCLRDFRRVRFRFGI